MSDKQHHKYMGMNIHDALAAAKQCGQQIRVLTNGGAGNTTVMRYADEPHAHHICVHVKNGVVTSTA